jgi:hypothetical protein
LPTGVEGSAYDWSGAQTFHTMSPIHFCTHTKDRFKRDLKRAKLEIEREKREKHWASSHPKQVYTGLATEKGDGTVQIKL